jgi:hypothetical protein
VGNDAKGPGRAPASWYGLLGLAALLCAAANLSDEALLTVKHNLASAKSIVSSDVSRAEKVDDLVDVARAIADTETMGRHALGDRLDGIPPPSSRVSSSHSSTSS